MTDGLAERTLSRVLAASAAAAVVAGSLAMLWSSGASETAKNLGVLASFVAGIALVLFGFFGKGSLALPVWMLTLVSALTSLPFGVQSAVANNATSPSIRAGLMGIAIVASAVTSQYAFDRRFALPVAPGQLRKSTLTHLIQFGSAILGLVSVLAVLAVLNAGAVMPYWWFFVGITGLFGMLVVTIVGLRR
jgi:hypothetical protein